MTIAPQGALALLYTKTAIGSGGQDFTSSPEIFEFLSETMSASTAILDTNGIRGTRSVPKERSKEGVISVGGTITMNPSPLDLDIWLPRILGDPGSGGVFPVGDTFSEFSVQVERDDDNPSTNAEYTDCLVNRATFRGSAGGLLEMELEIIGKTEILGDADGSGDPLGTTVADQPYSFHEAAVTLPIEAAETTVSMMDFEISIDNVLEVRFTNSQNATSICPSDRVVTASFTVPYDESTGNPYSLYKPSARGGAGSVLFTMDGLASPTLLFDFIDLRGPDITPTVTGKTETTLSLSYRARKSGTTNEIIITNDSTVP